MDDIYAYARRQADELRRQADEIDRKYDGWLPDSLPPADLERARAKHRAGEIDDQRNP